MALEENYLNYQREDFPAAFLRLWSLSSANTADGEDYKIQGEADLGRLCLPRILTFLHRFFTESEHSRGQSVMDVCCGPTIHCVMSASKFYQDVYMTEFSAANRRAVHHWWRDEQPAMFDWSPHFKFVADLEGCSPKEVEERLRSRIHGVYPCDLTKDKPLGELQLAPVDCVISALTVTAVAKTTECYSEITKKVVGFLKPGGVLLMVGIIKGKYFCVNGVKYDNTYVEEEFVKSSLLEAGMEIEKFEKYPLPVSDTAKHGSSYCLLAARKM